MSPDRFLGALIPEDSAPSPSGVPCEPAGPARFVGAILAGYKRLVSPMLPPACRFEPTCSVYAHQAVLRHGVLRGAGLALRRLARCHPFNPGGPDPVP